MDLNNNHENVDQQNIFKRKIKFKNNDNGVLLKIHHNEKTHDEVKRIPFNYVCFDDLSHRAVAIDNRGNMFVFDLLAGQFWSTPNTGLHCSFVTFESGSRQNVVIGTKTGLIVFIDTNTCQMLRQIQAFTTKVIHISYAPVLNANTMLTSSKTDAILCDLDGDLKYNVILSVSSIKTNSTNLFIKRISFIDREYSAEKSMRIFALLNDDSIYIWENAISKETSNINNFHLSKHIHPIEQRDRFLENRQAQEITSKEKIIKNEYSDIRITNVISPERIASVCGNYDGSKMFIATIDYNLMILDTTDWKLLQVFQTKCFIPIDCEFFSFPNQHDSTGMHCALSVLTQTNVLVLLEISDDNTVSLRGQIPECKGVKKQILSKNNQKLAVVLDNGKIFIYDLTILSRNLFTHEINADWEVLEMAKAYEDGMKTTNRKLADILPRNRLHVILKEYKEYPETYRHLIWKAMLQLPDNTNSFTELLRRGVHPCARDYGKIFPLRDQHSLQSLIMICSCLAHWCPIFGLQSDSNENFLPNFIFPFVKLFSNNLLMSFEIIATILFNQCQLWFEFSPIEPINYLGMVENILNHFEPSLLTFYSNRKITAKTFAWKMFRTAFTEVFNEIQWLQVWDHILSNPPYFLLFVAVAYNIVQKTVIVRLPDNDNIEAFFDDQNNIDMKAFIEKIYNLMEHCPEHLHPKQYMYDFQPLQTGYYQKFTNYPREMFKQRMICVEKMNMENKRLNQKYVDLEKLENALMDQLTFSLRADEHQRRLQQVENAYEEILLCELERIANQRKHLILLERQINDREKALLVAQHENDLQNNILQQENEVQSHLRNLERDKIVEEVELMSAEEKIRNRQLDATIKRTILENIQNKNVKLEKDRNQIIRKLEREKLKWRKTVKKMSSTKSKAGSDKSESHETVNGSNTKLSIEALEKATNRLEEAIVNILKL